MALERGNGGFSLIELLVAMLIAVTVVLGFAGGTLAVMRNNRVSEKLSNAAALAQERFAILKATAAADDPLTAGGEDKPGGFRVEWTLPAVGGLPAGSRAVSVTVSWADSRTHTIRFETIIWEGLS